jgi:hypothetical protein
LLFYALAQAGRAVCAAGSPGQTWRPRTHGLAIGDPYPDIGSTTITPDGRTNSAFRLFCSALGSAPLTAPTTLGNLWATNRVLQRTPELGASDHQKSLRLNEADDVLHPLAQWWAVLLGLSSLARYHPERWGDALARDKSAAAIPIEEALDIGRDVLPGMLLDAITAQQAQRRRT